MQELTTAAILFVGLIVLLEIGFRLGRRIAGRGEAGTAGGAGQVGAVQGAVLGLLGLLLGFSFGGAASRFLERQDLITTEANAIGTAYLRADLLDEPYKADLRTALKTYTKRRLEVSATIRAGLDESLAAEVDRMHNAMWKAASAGGLAKPAMAMVVIPPVNDVIDLHSLRVAAGRKHLPMLVMGLLIACSGLAVAVIGYGCGLAGRRNSTMTVSLAILIGTALWTTIDLDHPRAGLIQLSDAPLAALKFDGPP
jgi:hypothetical protein